MQRRHMTRAQAQQKIKEGGVYRICYRRYDGVENTGVFHVLGCTYVPNEQPYLICADRWIPLAAVYSIQPYRVALEPRKGDNSRCAA